LCASLPTALAARSPARPRVPWEQLPAHSVAPPDTEALYVTTNGGMTIPYHAELQAAKLLRIDVGEHAHLTVVA
jgi:hypothetical protein